MTVTYGKTTPTSYSDPEVKRIEQVTARLGSALRPGAYLVDTYRDISGDGLTTCILIRNTMSFAIGYGITPWLDGLGTQNCFISVAFVGLAICSVYLVMIKWGKKFREAKRVDYWNEVKKRIDLGLVH